MRQRLLKDESGFTLIELLVTMMIMLTVMFALYSIFDMSIRVFSFGNDKTEAVENARLGLERMEREIRAAYPVDKPKNLDHLFFSATDATNTNAAPVNAPPEAMPTDEQITFGNDLDGDEKVSCPNTEGDCEYITYRLDSSNSTLLRNNTVTGSNASTGGDPVAEFVNGASGLEFTYCESAATCPPILAISDEGDVKLVRIELEVRVKRGFQAGTQTLTTDVALQNRTN